jgi:hypothetical protein
MLVGAGQGRARASVLHNTAYADDGGGGKRWGRTLALQPRKPVPTYLHLGRASASAIAVRHAPASQSGRGGGGGARERGG